MRAVPVEARQKTDAPLCNVFGSSAADLLKNRQGCPPSTAKFTLYTVPADRHDGVMRNYRFLSFALVAGATSLIAACSSDDSEQPGPVDSGRDSRSAGGSSGASGSPGAGGAGTGGTSAAGGTAGAGGGGSAGAAGSGGVGGSGGATDAGTGGSPPDASDAPIDSGVAPDVAAGDGLVDGGSSDGATASKVAALVVYDTNATNVALWAVKQDFQVGVHPWPDFAAAYVEALEPIDSGAPSLLGREWIQTAVQSKNFFQLADGGPAAAEATVKLSASANVYLIVDNRAVTYIQPATFGWTDTMHDVTIFESSANHRPFSIYVKTNQTGDVDLPIQHFNGAFNYFVVID
jgi:hypothetical protein